MGRLVLTDKIGIKEIRNIDVYRAHGGYSSLIKAIKEMTPADVSREVTKSGLRGRGGAGFPTGLKWSFLDRKSDKPRYLVCNADESEPGTFKDRYLMEHLPHLLIEGLIISSFALGVRNCYIYIRGEFRYIMEILQQAIHDAYQQKFLGENILGSEFSLDIYLHPGEGSLYLRGRNSDAGISGRETGKPKD